MRYTVYKCGVCNRETEIEQDAKRPDPVRCNITLNCRGKLQRINQKNVKSTLFTPIVQGVDDYIPRFTDMTVPLVTPIDDPISIFSGFSVLSMALIQREIINNESIFSVLTDIGTRVTIEKRDGNFTTPQNCWVELELYEVEPTMLKYKKYTFSETSIAQLIRGVDNSSEGLNLKFSELDTIKVIINGVEANPDSYDRTVNNEITMTPVIVEQDIVIEIYVYKNYATSVDQDSIVRLKFEPLTSSNSDFDTRSKSSWGDFAAVEIDSERKYIIYCTDTSALNINKSYGISAARAYNADTGYPVNIALRDLYILLGREPYMFQDKELHAYVIGNKLISQTTLLSYNQSIASGEYELVIDYKNMDQVYLPITPSMAMSQVKIPESPIKMVHNTNELKLKYIVGPS